MCVASDGDSPDASRDRAGPHRRRRNRLSLKSLWGRRYSPLVTQILHGSLRRAPYCARDPSQTDHTLYGGPQCQKFTTTPSITSSSESARPTPPSNPGDYREGGGTDSLAHRGVREEKIGSDPEPGDFDTDPIDPEMGSPDNISALEQNNATYAEGAAETAFSAMAEPWNVDEAITEAGSAIRPEDTVDESNDDYTEEGKTARRK